MPGQKKPGPPAREAQLAYLAALGVTDPPRGLDLADARKLIEEAIARGGPGGTQRGPAPDGQIERILELGGSPWDDISNEQASRLIAFLCERQPVCSKCAREVRATDARCPGCGSFLSPCPVPHPGPEELPQAATGEVPGEMDGDLAIDEAQATDEVRSMDENSAMDEGRAGGDAHGTDEVDAADELWIADQVRPADEVSSAVDGRAAEGAHAADEVNATDELRTPDEVQPTDEVSSTVDSRAAEGAHAADEVNATDELRVVGQVRPADEARSPPRPDRPIAAPGVCPYCGAMTDVPSGAVTVNCSGCHRLYPAEPLGQRKGWLGGLFRSGR